MSFAEFHSAQDFLALFLHYRNIAYPILFLGAFFETLIPFSLVVYGEPFFIAGAVLAGTGMLDIWSVAAVLYAGGILGDNCSYWFGRWYGMDLFNRLAGWPPARRYFRHTSYEKGISFFKCRGSSAVFFARLSGPFSWFVPALAGMFRLRYSRFILFNTLGVVIGIGEFLVLGYFFGNNLDSIIMWLARLGYIPPAIILLILTAVLWRRCTQPASGRKKLSEMSIDNNTAG